MIAKNIIKIITNCLGILLCITIDWIIILGMKTTNYYVLTILAPLFFVFFVLAIDAFINMFLTLLVVLFGRNDNIEIVEKVEIWESKVSLIKNKSLLIILLGIILVTMIMDILLCIKYNKMLLLSSSLLIWIILIYIITKNLIKKKKE